MKRLILVLAILLIFPSLAFAMGDDPDPIGYKCYGPLKTLKEKAEQGDSHSQLCLGDMYRYGGSVRIPGKSYYDPNERVGRDKKEVLKWYRKAVAQGNSFAQYHLGTIIYRGEGIDQNRDEGMKWIRKAADQGNSSALRILGMLHLAQGDAQHYGQAVKWLNQWDTEFGHFWNNVFVLPVWFKNTITPEGKAFLKDIETSLLKLAKKENAEAQYLLYFFQEKHNPEWRKSIEQSKDVYQLISQSWLCKSAENGYAKAQLWCGWWLLRTNREAIKNEGKIGELAWEHRVEAFKWIILAFERGIRRYGYDAERWDFDSFSKGIREGMSPEQLAEAQKRAWEWKPKSKKQPIN